MVLTPEEFYNHYDNDYSEPICLNSSYPYNHLNAEDIAIRNFTPLSSELIRSLTDKIISEGVSTRNGAFSIIHDKSSDISTLSYNPKIFIPLVENGNYSINLPHLFDLLNANMAASQFVLSDKYKKIELVIKADGSKVGAPDILSQHAAERYLSLKKEGLAIFEGEEINVYKYPKKAKTTYEADKLDGTSGFNRDAKDWGMSINNKLALGNRITKIAGMIIHPELNLLSFYLVNDKGKLDCFCYNGKTGELDLLDKSRTVMPGQVKEKKVRVPLIRFYDKISKNLRNNFMEAIRKDNSHNILTSSTTRIFTRMLEDGEAMALFAPYSAHDVENGIELNKAAGNCVYVSNTIFEEGEKDYRLIIAGKEKGHALYLANKIAKSAKNLENPELRENLLKNVNGLIDNISRTKYYIGHNNELER